MHKRYPVQPARLAPRSRRSGKAASWIVAPALVLQRLGHVVAWRILACFLLAVSVATWWFYRSDRRRAGAGRDGRRQFFELLTARALALVREPRFHLARIIREFVPPSWQHDVH